MYATREFLRGLEDKRLLEAYHSIDDILIETADTLSDEFQLAAYINTQVDEWVAARIKQ